MADHKLKPDFLRDEGRIDWVDYAKGFCIIFVVMMHATLGVEYHAAQKGLVEEGAVGWMNLVVTFAQPFRMPDFFMISGLFLGLVIARPWRRYLDRKVIHFAYFYVLWLAIQFAFRSVGWVGEGLGPAEISQKFVAALIQPYGTLWFIYMLPVMFLVTRLLCRIHWLVILLGAALLEITPVHTGWVLIDEFASRYVYFFAGFALAEPIFRLAAWVRGNVIQAVSFLCSWILVNAAFTFTPVPASVADLYLGFGQDVPSNLAQLPIVSLLLGSLGAFAIICTCALLAGLRVAGILRYVGQNSIVVYLAFFLPMIFSRELLLRYASGLDLGTISLIVLIVSVGSAMVAWEFTRLTGWFRFLFIRPSWASIDRGSKPHKAGLQPAE